MRNEYIVISSDEGEYPVVGETKDLVSDDSSSDIDFLTKVKHDSHG